MINKKIKIVKLITGVDVVGEVETKEKEVLVRNPMRCDVGISGERANIKMIPWCVLSQCNWVNFQRAHVLNVLQPKKEVIDHYNQNFSPKKKGMGDLTILK